MISGPEKRRLMKVWADISSPNSREACDENLVSCTGTPVIVVRAGAGGPEGGFQKGRSALLNQYYISCHGASQQMNGFRLDRRSAAMKGGGTRIAIVPRNSDISRFYLRLITTNGTMPPSGRLSDRDISVLKNWIDQGAEWPDDVAGDLEPPPVSSRCPVDARVT
jgi:hypothetical protein